MKRIVLCADDYGQAIFFSQAIVELVKYHRLSATSCIVNGGDSLTQATWLTPFQDQIDIGLHFNLTEGEALSTVFKQCYGRRFFSLPQLLKKIFFHQLDPFVLEAECEAQINRFSEMFRYLPCFIDGHHHIHHFPIIRKVLIQVYERYFHSFRPYIRWVNESFHVSDWLYHRKKIVIHMLGSTAFKALLIRHHIPHNQSFCGIYHFSKTKTYRPLFLRFLQDIQSNGIIMCHPSFWVSSPVQGFERARHEEYQYFISPQFMEDLKRAGVVLGRFEKNIIH